MKRNLVPVAAALCATAAVSPAQAADEWQFDATLYVYLPSIGGKTTFPQSGAGSDIGLDTSKILDNLKMTFMGSLAGRKGRWGAFTDVIYFDIGNTKSATQDFTVGGTRIPADASAKVDLDLKATVWTLAGTYRALDDVRMPVDVFAGTRMLDIKQKLAWTLSGNVASIPLPGRAGSLSANDTNWDAIVGVKGRYALGAEGKWFVPYYLDVGTGQSTSTWQAMTGLGYTFGWGDVVGAWRYLGYNMKSGQKVESLNANGGAVAAVFHW